jgi:hypothetical protein
MTKLMIIGIMVFAAVTLTAYGAFSADYSRYTTEELSNMRGTMQNATNEERETFRAEWQKRLQNMTQEERQEYMGNPAKKGPGSGAGMMQNKGYGKGMGKGRKW